ncbi:ABC transporter substrate-binding protein [Homoserinibacter sp. GY 40078]|uniref:ABC transporter substrate-binding protein n=1 Tax=Homoserinibacter sp. GY 40078 TaxID=2603275 RepID=UPI00165063C4|nr:ABC transporter substrate-binding protein [Homoserinibacter sp. GY 40078]
MFPPRRRIYASAALALTGLIALSACSAGDSGESGDDGTKKPLVISLDSSVDILDPQAWRTPASMVTTGSLVEQLIEQTYTASGDLVQIGTADGFDPALAESFEYSEDGKVLTLKLREGLTFQDGSPLTADDVVWTFQRGLEGPGYIKVLYPMVGITSADQFVALDDLTVQITTPFATPLLPKMLAMQPFGILSHESGEANATDDDPWAGDWFRENDNSSGPYTVSSYDPTTSITLTPNESYYDQDSIMNSGVTIQFVSDPAQRALLLQSGEIDLAQGLPLDQVAELEDVDGLTVVSEDSNRLEYLGFNTSIAPFDDPTVRQAIAKALPYDTFVSDVLYGYAKPSTGIVPSGMVTHSDEAGEFTQNLDEARALLEEAGVGEFSTTLSFKQSSAVETRAAVFIQSALAELGITVEVTPLPDAEFTQRTNARELPMYLNNFLGWGADPFYQMKSLVGSGAGTNFTTYANEDLDALIQSGFETSDEAEREAISAEAQSVIYDEMPMVPIWNPDWTFVVRDGVSGLTKDNTEQLRLQYLTKE